jgi:hypothetical protein
MGSNKCRGPFIAPDASCSDGLERKITTRRDYGNSWKRHIIARGRLEEAIAGSVSRSVLRRVNVPVLLVKLPDGNWVEES